MDEEVHPAQAISEVLALLPKEGQLVVVLRVDIALNEHSSRAAARVEYGSRCRLEHRNKGLYDARVGKVLAAALALRRSKLSDEILVYATDQILPAVIEREDIFRE